MVADNLDVAPRRIIGLCRQAGSIPEATILEHLDKGGAVGLAEKRKLTARARVGPSPDVIAGTSLTPCVLVAEEGLEVNLVAAVLSRLAILAGGGTQLFIAVQIVEAVGPVFGELGFLAGTKRLHGHGIGGAGSTEVILGEDLLFGHGGAGREGGKEDGCERRLHVVCLREGLERLGPGG